mgnify:CR=1 FL=1
MRMLSIVMWWSVMLVCCFVPAALILVVSASIAQLITQGWG